MKNRNILLICLLTFILVLSACKKENTTSNENAESKELSEAQEPNQEELNKLEPIEDYQATGSNQKSDKEEKDLIKEEKEDDKFAKKANEYVINEYDGLLEDYVANHENVENPFIAEGFEHNGSMIFPVIDQKEFKAFFQLVEVGSEIMVLSKDSLELDLSKSIDDLKREHSDKEELEINKLLFDMETSFPKAIK